MVAAGVFAEARFQPGEDVSLVRGGRRGGLRPPRPGRGDELRAGARPAAGVLRRVSGDVPQRRRRSGPDRATLDAHDPRPDGFRSAAQRRPAGLPVRRHQDRQGRAEDAGGQEAAPGVGEQHQARIHLRALLPGRGGGRAGGGRVFRAAALLPHPRGRRLRRPRPPVAVGQTRGDGPRARRVRPCSARPMHSRLRRVRSTTSVASTSGTASSTCSGDRSASPSASCS
jgi:hypothetical protein